MLTYVSACVCSCWKTKSSKWNINKTWFLPVKIGEKYPGGIYLLKQQHALASDVTLIVKFGHKSHLVLVI